MLQTVETIKNCNAGLLIFALVFSISGCSVTGFGPDVDNSTTSAVIKYDEQTQLEETVDPSDWDKVRAVMATALVSRPEGQPVPWQNDVTGTIGTIVPMQIQTKQNGTVCRTFSTTLNGIGGVLQYRGDACQSKDGNIELIDLAPHNAVVDVSPSISDQKVQ